MNNYEKKKFIGKILKKYENEEEFDYYLEIFNRQKIIEQNVLF